MKKNVVKSKETSMYKYLFMRNNKFNFVMTFIAQVLSGIWNILLALLMASIADAFAEKSWTILKRGMAIGTILIIMIAISSLIKKKYVNKYIMTGLSSYKMYSNR